MSLNWTLCLFRQPNLPSEASQILRHSLFPYHRIIHHVFLPWELQLWGFYQNKIELNMVIWKVTEYPELEVTLEDHGAQLLTLFVALHFMR